MDSLGIKGAPSIESHKKEKEQEGGGGETGEMDLPVRDKDNCLHLW